jgi:hypothetical protein
MDESQRVYRSPDGREWVVTLETPGRVLSVPPGLEKSGVLVPEHAVYIVFASGDETLQEEYTELAQLQDLSDDDLDEWFRAAERGTGL